jgi:hypothetical protein
MRKLLVIAVVVAASGAARADVGLGVFVGEPTGLDLKIGLARRSALDLVLGWDSVFHDGRDHYAHVTYLATLAVGRGSSVLVPVRLGIGGAIYDDGSFDNGTNLAVRAPLEIGFQFRRAPVEIYAEVALKLTFIDQNNNDPTIDVDGGVGFRVYF